MRANPGGAISGEAIIGRDEEIGDIWRVLKRQSVLLVAERRVGKTSLLRKMCEHPENGWVPLMCWVEQCGHPIDCVERIYQQAEKMHVKSKKGGWLKHIRSAYEAISGMEMAGWHLPPIKSDWKHLLGALIRDIAENTDNRILIVLDEFPLMISKISMIPETGPALAMDFLDTLRGLRQEFDPSGRVRWAVICKPFGLLRFNVLFSLRLRADTMPRRALPAT